MAREERTTLQFLYGSEFRLKQQQQTYTQIVDIVDDDDDDHEEDYDGRITNEQTCILLQTVRVTVHVERTKVNQLTRRASKRTNEENFAQLNIGAVVARSKKKPLKIIDITVIIEKGRVEVKKEGEHFCCSSSSKTRK